MTMCQIPSTSNQWLRCGQHVHTRPPKLEFRQDLLEAGSVHAPHPLCFCECRAHLRVCDQVRRYCAGPGDRIIHRFRSRLTDEELQQS